MDDVCNRVLCSDHPAEHSRFPDTATVTRGRSAAIWHLKALEGKDETAVTVEAFADLKAPLLQVLATALYVDWPLASVQALTEAARDRTANHDSRVANW